MTIRRTTMFFMMSPTTAAHCRGWQEYVKRFQQEITTILWYRAIRKTPRERIANGRLETRLVKSGVPGVIEATAIWEERE